MSTKKFEIIQCRLLFKTSLKISVNNNILKVLMSNTMTNDHLEYVAENTFGQHPTLTHDKAHLLMSLKNLSISSETSGHIASTGVVRDNTTLGNY